MKTKLQILCGTLAAIPFAVWAVMPSAKTVTISSKQFTCTATDSVGIEARCTQYTLAAGVRFSPKD